MNYTINKKYINDNYFILQFILFDLPHHIIEKCLDYSDNYYQVNKYHYNGYNYIKLIIHYDNNKYINSDIYLITYYVVGVIINLDKQDLIQILYFNDIYLEID